MNEFEEGRVLRMVRASIAPVKDADPARDLWPDVISRVRKRPRVSPADLGLLGIVLASAPFFPQTLLFLVYSV
jgi:hypothetical protein